MATTYQKNQTVKLDDFGTIRDYRIVKILPNGDLALQSAGVACFTASVEWVNANKL